MHVSPLRVRQSQRVAGRDRGLDVVELHGRPQRLDELPAACCEGDARGDRHDPEDEQDGEESALRADAPHDSTAATTGSGRTITVSATLMISSTGSSAAAA